VERRIFGVHRLPSATGSGLRKLSDPARNVRDVIAVPFEVSPEVFALPAAEPWDRTGEGSGGVPAGMVLLWVEDAPFTPSSIALLTSIDINELGPRDRPRLLKALDRLESHFAARKSIAVAQLARDSRGYKGWDDQNPAANETSIALRLPLHQAQAEASRSLRLHTHLPGTLAMWLDGRISRQHVRVIHRATASLGQSKCAQVEEIALPGAESLSVMRFKEKVQRAVAKVNPRDLTERHRDAAKDADVTMNLDENAIGWINANMPGVDAHVIMAAVDAYARAAKAKGDERSLAVLRAEGLRVMCERYLTGELTGRPPTMHGRPVTINLCATPAALLGLTDTPAVIPDTGTVVPINTIREMAHEAKLRWMTISETNGSLIDYVPTSYRLSRPLHEFIDAAYVRSVGPHSTAPAARTDGEHLIPHGTPGGITSPDNTAPMDRGWHNAKTHLDFKITRNDDGSLTWTTPLGQTFTVQPYDYRLGP
jgi:hypothetical protein